MSSQRYLGTSCIDLRDAFSFDPKTTTEFTDKQQYEITHELAKILQKTAIHSPIRYNHAPGNPIGKIHKMWTDGPCLYTELEIWDELYNESIAKGDNRELSLSHIPDWENLENSRVTELSICPKAMRPGCKIIGYHRGKPGEVEVQGNEWILWDDEKLTTEDDLHPSSVVDHPIAIEASSSLSHSLSSKMTDMDTVPLPLPIETNQDLSPEEEAKTPSLPLVNPGESEEAYWARVMKMPDYQTMGLQEKEDLHRVLIESQRNKDELMANRQKIVDMKANFADQLMPYLKSASNKENRNDSSTLQPYIAASTTLDPALPAPPVTMSEEERVLNKKIQLEELAIKKAQLEISRQKLMRQANQPPQPQPPALAKYRQQQQQQQPPAPQKQANKRRYEEEMDLLQEVADEQIDQQDQQYEEEYTEGDDPNQQMEEDEGQGDAYQEFAAAIHRPQPPPAQRRQAPPPQQQRRPQMSVYEQNKQRLNQQAARPPPPARQHQQPQELQKKSRGQATGFDLATLRRPGTIPANTLPTGKYLEIQAADALERIPDGHIRNVISRCATPAQTALFSKIVEMYPYAQANPSICKLYCDENNASPWEKRMDGMAQDMKYCDPSKNQTTLDWANQAGIGKYFEGRLGYTGR